MLNIALDIDDTIAGFWDSYIKEFGQPKTDHAITRNVYKLRNNDAFWEGLSVIDRPDFEPHIYCTKRINSKRSTRNWLINNGFPLKPIYQMYSQLGNKADMIKGRCDVLIDDSPFNIHTCNLSGLPALLIDRDVNQNLSDEYKHLEKYRIHSLKYEEIERKFNAIYRNRKR